MEQDLYIFIETIESIPGITYLRQDMHSGFTVRFYQGLKGNLVPIDASDEDIPSDVAIAYLKELGLDDLIYSMFPDCQDTSFIPKEAIIKRADSIDKITPDDKVINN